MASIIVIQANGTQKVVAISGNVTLSTAGVVAVMKSSADCLACFGAGTDGNIASGAGTTTLTRDSYYNNVTLIAGDKIICNGHKLFIAGTLDITAADAGAIQAASITGNNGGNAVTTTAGAIPTNNLSTAELGIGTRGVAGRSGGTAVSNGANGSTAATSYGGAGGASGAGGTANGGGTAGGTGANGGAVTIAVVLYRLETNFLRGATLVPGAPNGAVGGSGGGFGGVNGGASGGSGSGGGNLAVFAATINRGGSTPAGCFNAVGGNGGNGGDATNNTGGGGGGSSAGGGGLAYIVVGALTGSTATNAIDASGGNGGGGGAGLTTGIGGNGGHGGNGGQIVLIKFDANTITVLNNTATTDSGTTAGTGTVGGTGGTGTSTKVSL